MIKSKQVAVSVYQRCDGYDGGVAACGYPGALATLSFFGESGYLLSWYVLCKGIYLKPRDKSYNPSLLWNPYFLASGLSEFLLYILLSP